MFHVNWVMIPSQHAGCVRTWRILAASMVASTGERWPTVYQGDWGDSYCWWLKSQTTTWDGAETLVNNGINYQPQLVGRISSINSTLGGLTHLYLGIFTPPKRPGRFFSSIVFFQRGGLKPPTTWRIIPGRVRMWWITIRWVSRRKEWVFRTPSKWPNSMAYKSGQFITTKAPVGHPKWWWKVREVSPKMALN